MDGLVGVPGSCTNTQVRHIPIQEEAAALRQQLAAAGGPAASATAATAGGASLLLSPDPAAEGQQQQAKGAGGELLSGAVRSLLDDLARLRDFSVRARRRRR